MSNDFSHLREWLARERSNAEPGMVILECIPSRSGMSMSVYDRDRLMFRVPSAACGGGTGKALAHFLADHFQPELMAWIGTASKRVNAGHQWEGHFVFEYGLDLDSVVQVAEAIGLKVQAHETRTSTLLIIEKVTR